MDAIIEEVHLRARLWNGQQVRRTCTRAKKKKVISA